MAKDPAFLFYYQDFAYGTRAMSFEEKGAYIELLCEQADLGHLSLEQIKRALKDKMSIWDAICKKFIVDANSRYYNETLENHIICRKNYVESRKSNLMGSHMKPHMATHMENVNVNSNIVLRTKNKNYDFDKVWEAYPKKLGRKSAERYFKKSILTDQDYKDLLKALENFKKSKLANGDVQYIPHGGTWFNNWRDWVDFKEQGVYDDRPEYLRPKESNRA